MSRMSRLTNRALDLMYLPGLETLHLRQWRGRIKCFLYHRVTAPDNDPFAFLTQGGVPAISPAEFEWDMRYLAGLGARFMTFEEVLSGAFPQCNEFGVIVAFDDCFADNHSAGLAILNSIGIKAVYFQTTGLIDSGEFIWEHALYWYARKSETRARLHEIANHFLEQSNHGKIDNAGAIVHELRENVLFEITQSILDEAARDRKLTSEMPALPGSLYPTLQQIHSTRRHGHEIGSHGNCHLKRSNISADMFREDLVKSRSILVDILGSAPKSYSFPFSSYLPGDEEICRQSFEMAATVERHGDIGLPLTFFMPRFTWPGPARTSFRQRRWLLTGKI